MTEAEIEIIFASSQGETPGGEAAHHFRHGPQYIARDFKEFIRISGMTHVRTAPYYPQSNGTLERWHKSLKTECIRPGTPLTPNDARRLIQQYVDRYNTARLHSAIGFITPADMPGGTAGGDPRGTRPQVGGRTPATAQAPAAGGLTGELH